MQKLEVLSIKMPNGRTIYTLLEDFNTIRDFTYKHYREDYIELAGKQVLSAEEAMEDITREMKRRTSR